MNKLLLALVASVTVLSANSGDKAKQALKNAG